MQLLIEKIKLKLFLPVVWLLMFLKFKIWTAYCKIDHYCSIHHLKEGWQILCTWIAFPKPLINLHIATTWGRMHLKLWWCELLVLLIFALVFVSQLYCSKSQKQGNNYQALFLTQFTIPFKKKKKNQLAMVLLNGRFWNLPSVTCRNSKMIHHYCIITSWKHFKLSVCIRFIF